MVVVQCQHGSSTSERFPGRSTRVGPKYHARRDVHEMVNDKTKGSSSIWVHLRILKAGFKCDFTQEDVFLFLCDAKILNADRVLKFDITKGDYRFVLCRSQVIYGSGRPKVLLGTIPNQSRVFARF